MHVMVATYGKPKKRYQNFTLGNLWATQPMALLIWPPLMLGLISRSTSTGPKHDHDMTNFTVQNALSITGEKIHS